jgi:molybdopterin-guanine dinucleotide biosynthesis protein A
VLRDNRPQPLFALYRVGGDPEAWHASAREALRGHGSPMRWHTTLETVTVAFDDVGDALHNLNTPDAFREYARTHAAT